MVPLPPLRPRRYFRRHGQSIPASHTLGVFVAATLVMAIAMFGVGSTLVQAIDPAATVPNPDKPNDAFCDRQAESFPDMPTPPGCNAPDEVPAREVLSDAFDQQLSRLVVAVPFVWLLGAGVVHLLSRGAGGEGSIGTTLGVVAWTLVPSAVQSVLAVGALRYLLGGRSVSDVERLPDLVGSVANHPLILAISVAGLLWSGAILYAGLRNSRGHDQSAAFWITALMVAIGGFFALV